HDDDDHGSHGIVDRACRRRDFSGAAGLQGGAVCRPGKKDRQVSVSRPEFAMSLISRLEYLAKDVRFGIRTLLKTPMLTAIAIGSLALGIGGSTAMFSFVHGVILDPFPYRNAARLMSVHVQGPRGGSNGSYYSFENFLELA